METTGKLVSVTRDIVSGKLNITFQIDAAPVDELNSLAQLESLDIKAAKHRKKRSLDANGYLWVLCTKIAEIVDSSKDEIYEEMLQKYGYLYKDDDGYITMTLKADADVSKIPGHWKFYKGNGKFNSYLMIKGSSEYDTSEMAKFIDAVVLEAKELGIETATPDEIERMKATWQSKAY